MQKPFLICLLVSAAMLAACSTDPEQSRAVPVEVPTNPDGSPVTGVLTANFDPTTGIVPTPNNLVFSGSVDGTLNIPVADPTDFSDPQVAINALDGWSTVAPISTTFSAAVDPLTVVPGASVRVFEVTLTGVGGAVTGVVGELTPGAEFVAFINPTDETGTQLVILPTAPLNEKSSYAVMVTNGVADADGNGASPSQIYNIVKRTDPLVDGDGNSTDPLLPDANAQALEPLRQLNNARESVLSAATEVPRADMALTWTFSTQSVSDVFDYLVANADPAAHMIAPTGASTALIGGAGAANIYFGWIDLPYYLQAPGDGGGTPDPTRILSGHWEGIGATNLTQFNPAPVERSEQRVPVVMTIPAGQPMPVAGWPIVVFQHGITGNRAQGLAIADAAAAAGFAMISIDQPLHGISDDPAGTFYLLYADNPAGPHATPGFEATERHFNVDLIDNATGAPGPDGNVDGSGAHTINLQSLLTARDNLRQASSDLLTIVETIPTLGTVDLNTFDETRIHFVGHSLGAIVGTAALGASDQVPTATLGMPGGGIARMLDGSPTFGPRIRAGLQAAGVEPGSADYNSFLFAAQTVIDSADPINHAIRAATNSAIHMVEVVGDGTEDNLPDQVVPNSVTGAPLSGTEPLAAVMGLASVSETTMDAAGVRGIVRFTEGDHGSLLSPAASGAATTEMQTEMATFFATFGTTLLITDDTVVQQP